MELWSDMQIYSSTYESDPGSESEPEPEFESESAFESCPESTVIRNGLIALAKLWLERSGTSIPISLELEDHDYLWDAYASLIRPFAPRLRRLRISGSLREILASHNFKGPGKRTAEYVTVMVSAATSSGKNSALEELVIVDRTGDYRAGRPRDEAVPLHFLAPHLKRLLVFIRHPFILSQKIFHHDNNQLTHIFLSTRISYKMWRYILKECSPRLECGAFRIREPEDAYEDSDSEDPEEVILPITYEVVILPKLTRLSLFAMQCNDDSFLHGIVCPSLQSFYIYSDTRYMLNRDFLRNIAPVRRLCVDFDASGPEYSMKTIFMAAPLLEVLIVSSPPNYNAIFDALMPNELHDVVPRLTSLVIFGSQLDESSDMFPVDRFINFLDSRWTDRPLLSEVDGTTCRLTDVQIHYERDLEIPDDARIALENFRDEGLRVVLQDDNKFYLTFGDWLQLELEQMDWAKGIDVGGGKYADDLRKAML